MVRRNRITGLGCVAVGAALLLSACASNPIAARLALDNGIGRLGQSAAGNYLAGRQAGFERDAPVAASYFQRALEADPGNATILERAFLLDVAAGDIDHAAKLGRDITKADPGSRMARLILALVEMKRKDYGDAIAEMNASATDAEADVVRATILAWALAGDRKFDEAAALLRDDDMRMALGSFGLYHEALILDLGGRTQEAESAYQQAMIASQGQSVRVLEAYGRLLERSGRHGQAVQLYNAYLQTVPGHPVIASALARAQSGRSSPPSIASDARSGVAEALYGIAIILAGEQSLDMPVVYAQLALYLDPDLEAARALLGDLYEQQERWADAVAAYSRIPSNSPVAGLAAVSIARNLSRLERNDDAIALMRKWSERTGDLDTFVTLGDLYRAEEKWELAAKAYDRALKMIPPANEQTWQVVYAKGIALERAGKWSDAEPLFRRALELEPDQPQVLNYLGYSWIDRGENLDEALTLIDRAVAQRPDDGYVVDSLGWAHYRLGDYDTAAYYLERAVELRPEDPTINDHLGDAYWRTGRRLEARFQWRHALSFEPTEAEAVAIRRKLEQGLTDDVSASNQDREAH